MQLRKFLNKKTSKKHKLRILNKMLKEAEANGGTISVKRAREVIKKDKEIKINLKKKIHYFINDEGRWICTMNGTEDDSVYDTLDGCGYKLQYGDPAKDFNEDGYHIKTLKENK